MQCCVLNMTKLVCSTWDPLQSTWDPLTALYITVEGLPLLRTDT